MVDVTRNSFFFVQVPSFQLLSSIICWSEFGRVELEKKMVSESAHKTIVHRGGFLWILGLLLDLCCLPLDQLS